MDIQPHAKLEPEAYLTSLLGEVQTMDENAFPPSDREACQHEQVIGEPTPYMKKMWALSIMYQRESERLGVEVKFSPDDVRARAQAEEAQYKCDTLREIFWTLVKQHTDSWGTVGALGMRKGWKLVRFEPRDHMPPIFRRLLGGE